MQYRMAERFLNDTRKRHAMELEQAYENIHPTRTAFDYDQKRLYQESVNVEDYAIYLVELQEEHERIENWWKIRLEAYKEAEKRSNGQLKKIKEILSEIISENPELQRKFPNDFYSFEDVEEYDRRIDNMSVEELLEDYWDKDEEITEEQLEERCVRLYESYDWTIKEIADQLGITTARVKKYVNRYQKTEGRY